MYIFESQIPLYIKKKGKKKSFVDEFNLSKIKPSLVQNLLNITLCL